MLSKKKLIIIITTLIFFALLCNCYLKKEKAINLAKNYLAQKYEFDSVYRSCRFSYIDSSQYIVTFSANNLLFDVIISSDLKTPSDVIRENYIYVNDDYVLKRFEFLIYDYLKVNTNGKFNGFISINNQPIYSFKISRFIKTDMKLDELEDLMDYNIYIEISENALDDEIKNIYDTINLVKDNNFTPQSITICMENDGVTDFININNLSEFNSLEDFTNFIYRYKTGDI